MDALGGVAVGVVLLAAIVLAFILFVLTVLAPYFLYRLYCSGRACERMLARCQWLLEQMLRAMPRPPVNEPEVLSDAECQERRRQVPKRTPIPIRLPRHEQKDPAGGAHFETAASSGVDFQVGFWVR